MKEFLSALLAIATVISICIFGMRVATNATASDAPHKFASLDAPSLWTSEPVRIDPRTQNYERLPSLVSVAPPSRQLSARDTPRPAANPIDVTTTGSVESQPSFPSADAEWCRQKYRSYHAEDNTYRPFSGKRRTCLSPYLDTSSGTAVAVADQPTPDHLSWCSQRYASYDPADNTYQPFGGGPRRPCVSSQAQ
ncbi:BA14K family protein [Rhizobium sp. P32RR-XVIII]|uniref:BA14K family protein n=1 Tax=Rhizobium sp. P32RR-XVIII TaxID=2726738 RepID=UPI001456850A|nr:BA14K family protein [Rhizobium sp. P32RR-XVIII]NLS03394.1 BA14K family protein [Rhizobium sp. P32RR-XVIII]